jgi:hypothetical protein
MEARYFRLFFRGPEDVSAHKPEPRFRREGRYGQGSTAPAPDT